MAAGGTHSLICGALWHTVVARYNSLTEAWLRIAGCSRIAATCEPHVKQLPHLPRAMGLLALPNRPPNCALRLWAHAGAREPHHPRQPPLHPASAVPSTLHGTQAPHFPVPSAAAATSTSGDAAGHFAAVTPGAASAAAAPAWLMSPLHPARQWPRQRPP